MREQKTVYLTITGHTSHRMYYRVAITEGYTHTYEAYARADECHTVLRWVSNDRPVPMDIMNVSGWFHLNSHKRAHDAEQAAALAAYIERQANRTPQEIAEHRAEVRAELGPGEEIVNVFTGEKYTT